MSVCLSVFLSVFLYITRLGVLSRIKCDLSCPLYRYRYIRRYSLGRSLLWHKLVIGLKLIKGEYCHINKCWTLISTGRPRCPTSLYWVNIDINSNILILQCLPLRSILQFDSVLWTGLLLSKASSRACSHILFIYKSVYWSFAHHSSRASIIDWTSSVAWYDGPYQPIYGCFWILPYVVRFMNIINFYDNILINKYWMLNICNRPTPLHRFQNTNGIYIVWVPYNMVGCIYITERIDRWKPVHRLSRRQ